MNRLVLVIALALCAAGLPALTQSGDITTDTTWTSTDSPIVLDPAGASGGIIKVRSGKTLTIDSSGGAVSIEWNEDCDLQIGNGIGDGGGLVIKANGNAITFKIKTGGNVVVNPYGSITYSHYSSTTTFTRYDSGNTWGAVVFEAGQTIQSAFRNTDFSYGGADSRDGMVVVASSATYTPTFNDTSFSSATTGAAALRMDGNGINVLRTTAITPPFDITSCDYAFYLNGVTSTVDIQFPDVSNQTSVTNRLAGSNYVGTSTEVSHWRFQDAYTTKCANSSIVYLTRGSVMGTAANKPVFRSISASPGYNAWEGFSDSADYSIINSYGGFGPLNYVEVRDANWAISFWKQYATYGSTEWRFTGLVIKHCLNGIGFNTGSGAIIVSDIEVGGTDSADYLNGGAVVHYSGKAEIYNVRTEGGASFFAPMLLCANNGYADVYIHDCTLHGNYGTAIEMASPLGQGSPANKITLERVSTNDGGSSFFTSNCTNGYGWDIALTLTFRNCFFYAKTNYGLYFNHSTTGTRTVLFEDCTILGATGTSGLYMVASKTTDTVTFRRCNVQGCTNGAYIVSGANNLAEFTFDQCHFAANSYGIYDARTQSARCVVTNSRFNGNTTYGAYDADATQNMLATKNEWNSASGPTGGGGSGDSISANVDSSNFLPRKPFDYLRGGSPASPGSLSVNEDSSTTADELHVKTTTPYFAWSFTADFPNLSQSAYEIDVDDSADFSSLVHNGAKTSTSSTGYTLGTALSAGTVYFVRLRLWNNKDIVGPWRFLTIRLNTTPGTVGNTNRTPADDYGVGAAADYTDATPQFVWEGATDSDEDNLHYRLDIDDDSGFGSINATLTSSANASAFEYSSDSGTTWKPFPSLGLPPGTSLRVRCTVPAANVLANGTWNWRVRATDGFTNGSYATTWDFVLTRSYTLSGTLTNTSGTGVNNATVKAARNGTVMTGSATTNASGAFTLTYTDNLVAGDILVVFRDAGTSTTRSARVTQFTGANMTGLDLRYKRAYVQQTLAAPIVNANFAADNGIDADIPWSETSGAIQFLSSLVGANEGVNVLGKWDLTGTVDSTTSNVEFRVATTGALRTLGYNIDVHYLDNDGTLEIGGGSRFMIDGSNSFSSGTLFVHNSTLRIQNASARSLTIDKGVAEFRNATVDVNTGAVASIIVDTASTSAGYAALDCTGTTFSKCGVVFETDGLVVAFNNNVFSSGVATRHIHWKCTDARSAGSMRGIQFDFALGVGQYNVEATAGANRLDIVKCGGVSSGEAKESDSGGKVFWSLVPPIGVKTVAGDTRIRVEWTADDQADGANTGYYVYRATSEGGSYSVVSGGSPITTAYYNDSSLTNGTTYWYYVSVVDTFPATDVESGGSARVSAAPAAAAISVLAPNTAKSSSILAMTVVGTKTHWDGSATLTVTKAAGSGVTVNDTIVLSATLMLTDVALNSATTGTWTVTAARNDVWGVAAYDESDTEDLTVSANPASDSTRPTLAFSTNNGGIGADTNTSGSFVLNIDFTDRGTGINTSALQLYASRGFDAKIGGSVTAINTGTEIVGAGVVIETLNDSRATWTIEQSTASNGNELFANGEYTVFARVADDSGQYSEWISRRFYVQGADSGVAKTTTLLKQGDSSVAVVISGTFSGTVSAVTFGSNITTVSFVKDSASQVTATVSVDQLAACGPRTFTVDMTTGTDPQGIVVVEYPTNVLPTNTNGEAVKNAATGGVGVFLGTGAFFTGATDLAGRGRVMGINWSRFYHSAISYNGPLGHKWSGYYFQRAIYDSGSGDIFWYTPTGRKETFPDVTGGFSNPAGVYMRATRETTYNTITLTDPHGHSCVFSSDGRLWKCVDPNGNKAVCFYNYAGQLTEIQTDLGKSFIIAYGADGRVSSVSDKIWDTTTPRVVSYTYDANGDLTVVKAPETNRYKDATSNRTRYGYSYDSAHRLLECINPREFSTDSNSERGWLENTYENGKVIQQRLGSAGQNIYIRYSSSTLVRVIDRRRVRTDYTLDASGRVTTVAQYTKFWTVDADDSIDHTAVTEYSGKVRGTDPDSYSTSFTYNSNHEILVTTLPRGNTVTNIYANATSETSGTATSAPSATVLTDNTKSWTVNAYSGKTLRVGSNAGEYRYYPIVSNTATAITINSLYSLSGDGWGSGEDYAVHTHSGDPLAAGNVISVTRKDESLGAEADIVTSFTYEPRFNHVKTVTDPRGYVTTYTYDHEDSASLTDTGAGNVVLVTMNTVSLGQPSAQTITSRTTYDEYGRVVTQTDPVGNVTQYVYYTTGDNNGYLKNAINSAGDLNLKSEYEYNKAGFMTASYPPKAFDAGATQADFKTTYEVNQLGQTWHTQGPLLRDSGADRVDVYTYYDLNGNVTNTFREYVEDDGGEASAPGTPETSTSFTKASTSMTATWIESSSTFNLLNYPISHAVDAIAGSAVTRYTSYTYYDDEYNVIRSASPLGNSNATVYDERGMVYQRIAGEYSDVRAVVSTVSYDANGNTSSSVDARGNTSTFTYDGFDRMTQSTDPQGHYRTTVYDAAGNATYSRAYDSSNTLLTQTQSYFDEVGRSYKTETLTKDYLGNNIGDGLATNTTLFDAAGRVTSSTNDNGVTHYSFYDGASRVSSTRDAKGNEVRFTYNSSSLVTVTKYFEVDDLSGANLVSHTTAIYDKSDRRIAFQDQRYNASTRDTEINWVYDGDGRVTTFTDADGSVTTSLFDLLGRAMQTTRKPVSGDASTWIITANQFDADSRLTMQQISKNPNTNTSWQTTLYRYDERGRRVETARADSDVWVYHYDALGNLVEWQDPLATRVTTAYDSRNLPTSRVIQRGTGIVGATQENYGYDGLGRLTSASNYDGSNLISATSWSYNTLSLCERAVQTIANSTGAIMGTYETRARYDATGFNTATIFANGREVIHTPDELNRLAESYDITNGVMIANYSYAGSRLTRRIYGNGAVTNYSYEAAGCGCGGASNLIEEVEHKIGNNELLFSSSRRFGLTGLVMSERRGHEGGMGNVYRYDSTYRLTATYYGVDLYDNSGADDHAGFASPANDARHVCAQNASYGLDQYGNRYRERPARATPTTASAPSPSGTPATPLSTDDMNLYSSVGLPAGTASYTYDAIEQMTYDGSRGLY
jgi:YD repeat-containing protein